MANNEKRTEYVGVWLTPEMAKQLKEAADNDVLKDKILKQFVTNETDWLRREIADMEEITTIYRAKLLTIKDNFSKAQDIYVEEIESLMKKSNEAIEPLNEKFDGLKSKVESVKNEVEKTSKMVETLSSKINYVNYSNIEKLLDAVDRYNKMSEQEKEIIKLIIERK